MFTAAHQVSEQIHVKNSMRLRRVSVCFGLILSGVGTLHVPARAETIGASCSAAYHAALNDIRVARGEDLTGAVAALRAADPALPGQWIYARALFGKSVRPSRPIEAERVCAEKIKIAGRLRCTKFVEPGVPAEPELPTELDISPPPSSDELRVLKAVADLVTGRGAVPDVGNNGRYSWLSQRATSDLRLYISQPPHAALCSGAREIVEFYGNALKPLQKRQDDVGELVKRARSLAAARVVAVLTMPSDTAAVPAAAPEAIALPPDLGDIAKLSLVAMTGEAVRAVLPVADVAAILDEKTGISALRRAKTMLIVAQVEAGKTENAPRAEKVLAVGRAVRIIEAAAYTEIYADRYRKFGASVLTLPRELQSAHARTCTCGN